MFGAGGDRDRGKRPLMGRVAADLADRVYVTDDNPRSENPAEIRRAILAAAPGAVEIGDRHQAIGAAIAALRAGDVLVIAGKGHETGQIVGGEVLPFDDAAVAREALARLGDAAGMTAFAAGCRASPRYGYGWTRCRPSAEAFEGCRPPATRRRNIDRMLYLLLYPLADHFRPSMSSATSRSAPAGRSSPRC